MKRRRPVRKLYRCFSYVILSLICCYFTIYALQRVSVKTDILAGNINHYSGEYEFVRSHNIRNTTYTFILDSGDRICVTPELVDNVDMMLAHDQLAFSYADTRIGLSAYFVPIEIASTDGRTVFLNASAALEEIGKGIIIGFSISLPIFLLIFAPICFHWLLRHYLCKRHSKNN